MTISEFFRRAGWFSAGNGPRYVQLRRRIEEGIETGVLTPESSLPAEREIAFLTDMSRVTVRRAIRDLVDRGVIHQRQGSGSFINPPARRGPELPPSHPISFSENMDHLGATSQWLERAICLPSPDEARALALTAGESVSRLARLRIADGRPLALERAALPVEVLPDPMAVTKSLYDVLGARGMRPLRAIQKISAVNLEGVEAELLRVPVNAAALRIERRSYLDTGRIAEFTRSICRGDAYDFVVEFRISDKSTR